jgi:hypothetical protein
MRGPAEKLERRRVTCGVMRRIRVLESVVVILSALAV